ncbi:MAG: hypothetical protein JST75_08730 [Bacteroidetes bacterium]|nr:hypothetical protein [Bacteroidota bacterium]
MNQFTIVFNFEGQFYAADVTQIGGLDDTQYAISQQDANLAERFKSNVIRESKDDGEFQYAIPRDPAGVEFMESLVKGLKMVIHK